MSDYRREDTAYRAPNGARRRPPQKKRRKKKSNAGFIVFISVILLVIIALVVLFIFPGVLVKNDTTTTTSAPFQQTTESAETTTVQQNSEVPQSTEDMQKLLSSQESTIAGLQASQMVDVPDLCVTPNLDPTWFNVLLLGSDARNLTESARTDTMIICSINQKTGEVKLTSLLRDTAIEFTDIGKYNGTYRLNAANYFGGPRLVMKTLNTHLAMNIEYYVMVDFTSFSIIAEKLGGIEMTISEEEMEQINKNAVQQAWIAYNAGVDESEIEQTNVYLEEYGENVHLNGRQTLAYARIRKIDNDITRAERQRKVLTALLSKLKTKNTVDVASLIMSMSKYVATNMDINDIITNTLLVMGNGLDEVPQMRIPVNGSYVSETRGENAMLYDVDWAYNTQELHNFIYD